MTFSIWEDSKEPISVSATDMNAALDEAAKRFGYADYADMAQERGWGEEDGLNIEIEAA